jgi:hypothetical protein
MRGAHRDQDHQHRHRRLPVGLILALDAAAVVTVGAVAHELEQALGVGTSRVGRCSRPPRWWAHARR